MKRQSIHNALVKPEIHFDLGMFEGFNFRHQSAMDRCLTATEIVAWDHNRQGEAEFWPDGHHAGVTLVFKDQGAVTASELLRLDRLLECMGTDALVNFVSIYYAVRVRGADLCELTTADLDDNSIYVFTGDCFYDLRKDAAHDLFELFYPEAYKLWDAHPCDGLMFDADCFLDSPQFYVEEIDLGEIKCVIVATQ